MINNINYQKGFWIENNQTVIPYLFFDKISENIKSINILNEINQISQLYNRLAELIEDIGIVLLGGYPEIEIDTNMVSFQIQKDNTMIKNNIFDSQDIVVKTSWLKESLIAKINFINNTDRIKLGREISLALTKTKENNSFNDFNCCYTTMDGIYYNFSIPKSQLADIDVTNYTNNLIFKAEYFGYI